MLNVLPRYVVEVIKMVVDFIGNLETSMNIVRTIPTVDDSMNKLVSIYKALQLRPLNAIVSVLQKCYLMLLFQTF